MRPVLTQLLHRWPAKVGSLLAAVVVWYLLHQGIEEQVAPSRPPAVPASPGRFP